MIPPNVKHKFTNTGTDPAVTLTFIRPRSILVTKKDKLGSGRADAPDN